jgi:hypothetical protein
MNPDLQRHRLPEPEKQSSYQHSSFQAFLYNPFSERLQMKVGDTVSQNKIVEHLGGGGMGVSGSFD